MADSEEPKGSAPAAAVAPAAPAPGAQRPFKRPNAGTTDAPQATKAPAEDRPFEGYLAEVVDVALGRTGIYGEIKQAMCKVLEGKDKGRVIRRNVAGRIKKGDMIRLPDTSREDKRIMAR